MCSPKPPSFKPEPLPEPTPTPPPPEQTQKAPVTRATAKSKNKQAAQSKKAGTSSLIIDLALPTSGTGNSGLNI